MLPLPLLDAMRPAWSREPEATPRRMLSICTNLGLYEKNFFPTGVGTAYQPSPYLDVLKDWRSQLTVCSGTSHPDVAGGHSAEASFLTAAPQPGTASFRNSISIDQFASEAIGPQTRVSSLPLVVSQSGNQSLSFTSSGVMLPAERSPSAVYKALFTSGDAASAARHMADLRVGRSILDVVATRAASLQKTLGPGDTARLDQYFTAVREVEKRLLAAEQWEKTPKPTVDAPAPNDGEQLIERLGSMFELIRLAFLTDSTRLITLLIKLDGFSGHIPGVSEESHNLSHHGNRPDKLAQLRNLELAQFQQLAKLFKGLQETNENSVPLLNNTMVLFGSNLGNGNSHDTRNLPILLAGGGFKHGQHLAFDRGQNYPLPNLFVSMLQRLGLETDRFASSTGTMRGLESA